MTVNEPSWDEARKRAGLIRHQLSKESLSLNQCVGRTLAENATSLVDLPTYETSAMDGYAVSTEKGPWKIVGDVKAGEPHSGVLQNGEALQIATGAVIPDGTFGILRWENANVVDECVEGETSFAKDFRPSGEEAKKNDVLVESGMKLSPAMIGLLAASGYDTLEVVRKPKVALLLLGDEIQHSGLPKNGLVRDSIGVQLPSWLEILGCEVISIDNVSDSLDSTKKAILDAARNSDIVVTTGGTADGPRDFLHTAISELGGVVHVNKVAVRPGHPQLLGEIGDTTILGLPGNPQSAIVALFTLGEPLIFSMLGRKARELPLIVCSEILDVQQNFTRLVLGNIVNGEFQSGRYLGSAMLRSLAHSQGFAIFTNPASSIRWLELPL